MYGVIVGFIICSFSSISNIHGSYVYIYFLKILAETQEAKRVLADIEERHQQLLKIERMLEEVRDLFLQMAILVDAQVIKYIY